MNTELRKKANDFFQVDEQFTFFKIRIKCKKKRDIKLVTTKARKNYLVSESYYHKTKSFLKVY